MNQNWTDAMQRPTRSPDLMPITFFMEHLMTVMCKTQSDANYCLFFVLCSLILDMVGMKKKSMKNYNKT